MIKSKLRLFGWAVGLSLALGAVGAVAAQGAPVETGAGFQSTYVLTFTKNTKESSYDTAYTRTVTNNNQTITWSMEANMSIGASASFGGKSNSALTRELKSTSGTISKAVTKIVIATGTFSLNSGSVTAYSSTNSNFSSKKTLGTVSELSGSSTFTIDCSSNPSDANSYFQFIFTVNPNSTDKNKRVEVSSITFFETTLEPQTISGSSEAYVGETVALTTTATSPTWSIVAADTTAAGAAVTADGKVTVTGPGNVKVLSHQDGYSDATHTIEFSAVPTTPFITLTRTSGDNPYTGDQITISASAGNLVDPDNNIDWTVEAGTVTEITKSNAGFQGTLGSSGTVTVRAADAGDATFYQEISVTVTQSVVKSVTLDKSSSYLKPTQTVTLTPTVETEGTISSAVNWTTSDSEVATVSNGVVTAKGVGSATITATSVADGSKSASCTINVFKNVFIEDKTDALDRSLTGVAEGTNYGSWSDKTSESSAVYAGNSAGSYDSIQLRSSGNSGVVTTSSGGLAMSVQIKWDSNTSSSRILRIYGKNEAYTGTAELYSDETAGTELGTLQYDGTSLTRTLEVDGYYQYIGIRSSSGAHYVAEITIKWSKNISTNDIKIVDNFVSGKMHLDNTDNNSGKCSSEGWYLAAKQAYNGLTAPQKAILLESDSLYGTVSTNDWKYSDVKARYEAWAVANNDAAPYDGYNDVHTKIHAAGVVFKGIVDNARTPILVAAFAGVGALAVGGMVFLRKRKEF